MIEIKNALSNKVFFDEKNNKIIKYYSTDRFKEVFGCQEYKILSKIGYDFVLNKSEIQIEYFKHIKFNDKNITNSRLIQVSNSLKKLHKLNTDDIELSPFKKVYSFLKNEGTVFITVDEDTESKFVKSSLEILLKGNQVILHNDVVEGNLLIINNEIKLIDFEYSGLGNKIFDLASFITEREMNKKQIKFFIDEFDRKTNLSELKSVSIFLQIFWARWAYFKYELTKKEIYKTIGDWKMEQYKILIKKND